MRHPWPSAPSLVPDHVMDFVPAQVESNPGTEVSDSSVEVHYQVQIVGRHLARPLAGDPTLSQPVPTIRLGINAAATFLVVVVAGLAMVATLPALFGFGSVVVTSGSMEPAIRVADVVLTNPSEGNGLGEGAVINFDHDESGTTRLHRIAEVTASGEYRTAGDANRALDSELVDPSQVRGVGIVVVPALGYPNIWVDQGHWLPLLATIAIVVASLYVSRARWIDAHLDPLRP